MQTLNFKDCLSLQPTSLITTSSQTTLASTSSNSEDTSQTKQEPIDIKTAIFSKLAPLSAELLLAWESRAIFVIDLRSNKVLEWHADLQDIQDIAIFDHMCFVLHSSNRCVSKLTIPSLRKVVEISPTPPIDVPGMNPNLPSSISMTNLFSPSISPPKEIVATNSEKVTPHEISMKFLNECRAHSKIHLLFPPSSCRHPHLLMFLRMFPKWHLLLLRITTQNHLKLSLFLSQRAHLLDLLSVRHQIHSHPFLQVLFPQIRIPQMTQFLSFLSCLLLPQSSLTPPIKHFLRKPQLLPLRPKSKRKVEAQPS